MKTLNDLFVLDTMQKCTIIAGHRGLTRNVESVNISDTPDVVDFLDANQLLLTTGFGFKNDTQDLYDLVKAMHAKNCSGIIIKVNRFLKKIPEEVRLLADELAFPILDLPRAETLGNLSRHILNYLNDHELEELYYALHVQKKFSQMMIEEYDLNRLIEQLSYFIGRPVLMLNYRGETMARNHDFRTKSLKIVEKHIVKTAKENIQSARQGATFTIYPSVETKQFTTFPVPTKRQFFDMLVVIDAETLPYPYSQMAIEQASNVISFTLIKEQSVIENMRLLKNNFFVDLIEKRIQSNEEIENRATFYDIHPNRSNICIVCTIDEPQQNNYGELQEYERHVGELHRNLYDLIEDEIVKADIQASLFTKEKYFAILVQFTSYDEKERDLIKSFIQSIQENMHMDYTVSFGVSNPAFHLHDIPAAYYQSIEALESGYEMNRTHFIQFYKTRELKELLKNLPQKDLKALYESTLKNLAYPTTEEDIDLVRTIEVFLDSQCEISKTSRVLYVHRNTVKYRIKKAEGILDASFHDPHDSLLIRVALVVGTILAENES